MDIRNIAIIAHVDHGKTTLTDAILRQAGLVAEETSMDSDSIEQERGITIYAKNASFFYKNSKINIIDTPGHADFSSEVERVLRSIDSVLLLVDAQEGPMPQTKFVLKKSLELGLEPIVVINKVDKPAARPEMVLEMVYELFLDLGASDKQLDFSVVYAVSKMGQAGLDSKKLASNLDPLLDMIVDKVPVASREVSDTLLLAQPFNLAYDNFLGRLAICRIYEGKIKSGQSVFIKDKNGLSRSGKITKLFSWQGLSRQEEKEVVAGDIVLVAGLPDIFIGETICEKNNQESLPAISIDEPTICLDFLVNSSPFAGREGKFVTSRQIKERLEKELEVNVGLRIDFSDNSLFKVYGRGELHIAVLLENMRREGFELQVSKPEAIIKEEGGVKMEPFEELILDIPENCSGVVIEKIAKRRGEMLDLKTENAHTRLVFSIPTRGLLGYREEFIVDTKGDGILCSRFIGFKPMADKIEAHSLGSMVSMIAGKALAYSLWNLQERGVLYIKSNTDVYEGMVIGNVSKGNDMSVNPVKGKKLTNVRASGSDEAIILIPPLELSLERGLSLINDDEYLEITPQSIRLRKKHLTENARNQARKTTT
ncbi:MAG: translational GTPase TypA [Patescibacteria group bacterium]|nr:translational GTPase TypA [Patescibacteria group bacterium]MDD3939058.1 translational GTPase TypA [Patescibacteria group bacterium]NCU39291.1 translational GTPase TypA [Candidatus Falkowbacteria bacterium]